MRDDNDLARLTDAIQRSRTLDEMAAPLSQQLNDLGFAYMNYESVAGAPSLPARPSYITNFPVEWIRRYARKRYSFYDPVISELRRNPAPFTWSDSYRGRRLTSVEAQVMNEGAEFGLRSGGVVSAHSAGRAGWGFLSVGSSLQQEEFNRLFKARAPLLTKLVAQLESAFPYPSGRDQADRRRLSPREADILSWMALGKTRQEAARLVGISDHTAKDHLKRACLRLDAHNVTHAVAIAVAGGMLRLDTP